MQFSLVGTEDGQNITVFVNGEVHVAHSSHPNFDRILEGVFDGDESVVDLFDVAQAAATRFERLTERVTTANGKLYLDGVEVNNSLSNQVVRFLKEGVEDWVPLVNFFENVQSNPNEHSREQLYDWLNATGGFTITEEGWIIGYKGVKRTEDGFTSVFTGKAIVNGEVHEGHIPNFPGAVVTMPRDEVIFDPAVGCHQGLHVGTYEYAENFAKGALLEVHVNPRDVVSVPTENGWAKMRVCRYSVVDTIDAPHTVAVVYDSYGLDDNDPYCDGCGEYEDDCYCNLDDWGDGENYEW